jgi:hypothetical protein
VARWAQRLQVALHVTVPVARQTITSAVQATLSVIHFKFLPAKINPALHAAPAIALPNFQAPLASIRACEVFVAVLADETVGVLEMPCFRGNLIDLRSSRHLNV